MRVASQPNQWKMKELEKLCHCSHGSHFSHLEGERAGGVVPAEARQSLHGEARKANPQEIPRPPPRCQIGSKQQPH